MTIDDKRGTTLSPEVRERLGRELRGHLREGQDKPAYLGDPALPPGLTDRADRLARSLRASEEGLDAVEQALLGQGGGPPAGDPPGGDR